MGSFIMVYRILYSLLYLLSLIPRPLGIRLGEFLGTAGFWLIKRRRTIALENLRVALGEAIGEKERTAFAKKSFQSMGRHFFEVSYLIRKKKKKLGSYIHFEGLENLKRAREQGQGVFLLTGHFGCWELMAVSVGYFQTPIWVVTKPLDFIPAEKLIQKIRGISGNRCVSKEKSMRHLLRLLREKATIGILLDQNIDWYDGVFVPFFGKRACTNKGLALLVHKTRAPVVPIFIVYLGKGRYRIEFQPALPWLVFGDRTTEIEENTAQYNLVIEAMARKYPDHYFWVHQRWKTRPYQPWPRRQA
ncbi:MAG: lysophospholipid acyltransferase family protein [Thermodesulfobacteriota bacterium]